MAQPKIILILLSLASVTAATAQDINRSLDYDPDKNKIIPDKVFEIGLPLLVIFFLINAVVTIVKIRSDKSLKEKALDKNLSEATLVSLFDDNRSLEKRLYLRWFVILFCMALS